MKIGTVIKNELKTRNKYIIEMYYYNNELKIDKEIKLKVILTYNKKETKLLNIKSCLFSKIGLSFNNYNTKELDQYTYYRTY